LRQHERRLVAIGEQAIDEVLGLFGLVEVLERRARAIALRSGVEVGEAPLERGAALRGECFELAHELHELVAFGRGCHGEGNDHTAHVAVSRDALPTPRTPASDDGTKT
jgi:hypothetical protein